MKKFWFDGQCSANFGMMATGSGTFNAPERDLETISVAGRNGDLIRDNGRYKNIPVSYPIAICKDFPEKADAARAWLLSKSGYCRLEDGYNPDTYRMAMFKGPVNFDVSFLSRAGESTLKFDCKPQRYLKSGEHPILMDAAGILCNPTLFPALPLITVYGNGTGELIVGDIVVQIKANDGQIVLDSEMQDAYRVADSGTLENKNGSIYAPDFPQLPAGETAISWTGDIAHIEIIPRWWTL